MIHQFTCHQCTQHKTYESKEIGGGTGYGWDEYNNKICYDCCALNDAEKLKKLTVGETIQLYWDGKQITNWPGTLKIHPYHTEQKQSGFAGIATYIYFMYDRKDYLAKQVGDNQIARIKRLKAYK